MRKNKFVQRRQQSIKNTIIFFILLVGLGYALLQQDLDITGIANLSNPTWNIHWENVQVTDGSVTGDNVVTEPTIDSLRTTVTYAVVLAQPGDYYEFTVDAVNSGTINGMVESVSSKLNGVTITTLPEYLDYSVTYSDGTEIQENQLLNAGDTKTYKLKIKYRDDIELNQIPDSNQSLSLAFTVKYKQADISSPEETIITYNANGGTGTMENQTIPANSTDNLTKNTFTREGYSFKNWNTKADGTGTTYNDEEEVSNLGEITLYAQWKVEPFPYVFRQDGICTFNGSSANITGEDCSKYTNGKYIDTGIKLYSETNKGKDYEIGFTIEEYVPSSNVDQATLMNTKYESTGYPGVVFRKQDNTQFELASRKTSSANENYRFASAGVRDVKIWRINNEIYYKIDDGPKTFLNNLSQYNPTFDLNVWFGATPTNASATTAQRYFTGKLSNMYIKLGTYVENNSYTITFNPNGGEVDPEFISVSEGDAVGTLPTPTKTLHNFVGWYTGLTDGVEVTSTYEPSDDIEIFARWQKKQVYTISFDTDGGSSVDDIEIEQGTAIGTLPVPTKANMSFDGWYLESTYNTKVTSSYIPTESITLHAKWSDSTFPKVFEQIGACTFNGSSGTITGENCGDYVGQKYIDTGIALYSETNKNKDYEIGFTINSYTPADNESRATLMNTKLEATGYPGVVFRRNDATDNFVLQSRKTSSANEQKTFAYNTVTSVKVYRISNEIYYSINGGDKVLLNNLTEYNPTFNLTTWFGAAPSNEAGTAAQRYLKGTLSNMYIKLGEYEEAGKFNITLNPNGGEVNPTRITINQGDSIGTLPTPTLAENHFDGWYTSLTDGIEVDENYVPSGNMEIFAKWRNYTYYEVTFDKNDNSATGTINNQSIADGIPTSLNENQYSKEGYVFVGWNTESDGSGTSYLDKADITLTGNITLYAQWVKTYTLTFDKNDPDAVGDPYSIEVISGISTQIPNEAFNAYHLTGKSITSYNTDSDYSGTSYSKNQEIAISENTTLYAYWESVIYWALQDNDNDNDNINETLVLSSEEVNGVEQGSFAADTSFGSASQVPWIVGSYDSTNNKSYNVTTVNIEKEISPTSTAYWFNGVGYNAATFNANLEKLNISQVTNMSSMFSSAGYIATTFNMNLSSWDTSKVTNMSKMFSFAGRGATTWYIGNLSGWNTSQVTDMNQMFYYAGCNATTWNIGDLSGWNTSQVTNMSNMFSYAGCYATTFNLNLSGWNTSQVTNMSEMFYYAGVNETTWNIGDLSGWNTSQVTDMRLMFYHAGYKATTWNIGDLSEWDTSQVKWMSGMFSSAGYNATTWDIGDLSGWNTSQVTTMSSMFSSAGYNATTWDIGDLSGWNTSQVTNMSSMFNKAGYSATTFNLNLSGWDISKVTNMNKMFCYAGQNATTWYIGNLSEWNPAQVTDMGYMFYYAGQNATTWNIGDLSGWNTSQVTDMRYMFSYAGFKATTWNIGDLSGWNTSQVTNMSYMFQRAGFSDTTFNLNLSGWNTSKVTNMSYMFEFAGHYATTWNIGDLSEWDTSKVTNMSDMFSDAGYKATTWDIGDISGWDTSKVTHMSDMFNWAGCNATTFSLNLSGWDTSQVTNMSGMFNYAGEKATTWNVGDLSGWNTSRVTNMSYMFQRAGVRATTFSLNLSGWDTSQVTNMSGMFNEAGYSATIWYITIPKTNGNGINNDTTHMYGKNTSTYTVPPDSRTFTLAAN